MANTGANIGFEAELWKAADQLRGSMDAAEYKHVVLGLLFLKYISDAFEEQQAKLLAEADQGADPEDPDEYRAVGVFWVPVDARWSNIKNQAKQPTIGQTVDAAMISLERENKSLKDVLPKDYARPALDKTRLGQLIDTVSNIKVGNQEARSKDVLGRVYEYFLSQFASAEGKKGGEFYTPRSVVKLLVDMLEPYKGRVYDPCCGSSGMFVQSEEFIAAHGGKIDDLSIYGQESNYTTWRLAKMNLAIRGIEGNIKHGDTFHNDQHPDLKADYIIANPPFNISDWGGERLKEDKRWQFGAPPAGNANYAWVQHMIHKLSPTGTAGFVLANGSMSSNQSGEGEIRKKIIEADLVDCMVALPGQLFYSTPIPSCLWFLARDKKNNKFRDRRGKILFIDAREMGQLVDRTHRNLSDHEIESISNVYHQWRSGDAAYQDISGFCKEVDIEEVASHHYSLLPSLYVGAQHETQLFTGDRLDPQGLTNEFLEVVEGAKASLEEVGLSSIAGSFVTCVVSDIASTRKVSVNPSENPTRVYTLFSLPAFDKDRNPENVPGSAILSNKLAIQRPCVLFSKLNPSTSRVWLIDYEPPADSICSTEFLVLEPESEDMLLPLYCALRSAAFTRYICSRSKGSTGSRQRVHSTDVLSASIGIPSPEVLTRFNKVARPVARLAELTSRKSASISEVLDRLIAATTSTEVRNAP